MNSFNHKWPKQNTIDWFFLTSSSVCKYVSLCCYFFLSSDFNSVFMSLFNQFQFMHINYELFFF